MIFKMSVLYSLLLYLYVSRGSLYRKGCGEGSGIHLQIFLPELLTQGQFGDVI